MKVLDACCGSRMFWFDKENDNVTFMDIREYYEELESGHVINVNPDVVGDFRDMPFDDNYFDHVVFDPPHLIHAGDNSWLAKKYGKLDKQNWPSDISQGFDECMRVLKPNGTLVFKWNEEQVKLREILDTINYKPLYGNKRSKTHWLVFIKEEVQISYRVYSCSSEIDYISNKGLAETIQDAWNYEANVYDIEGNSIFESWLDNDEQNELLEPFLLEVFDYGKYRYLRRKDTKLVYLSKWQINPFKDNKDFKYKLV